MVRAWGWDQRPDENEGPVCLAFRNKSVSSSWLQGLPLPLKEAEEVGLVSAPQRGGVWHLE